MIAVRICKTSLVAATTLFLFLVVLNNLLDYGSNYKFVEGVLNMETTFPDNKLMWQSEVWDGGDPAFRMFAIMGICLIFLNMKDGDLEEE